ncbi:MAG: tRNA (guanosine(37)-N1)-methyltransferase TrmD [Bacilli bacterium]|nr:tRNA (guanosine(37)-N1)-methyltransferase TrmD [Bacilli bacterium]
MRIDILTLFPNMFNNILEESIIKRAIEKNLVEINLVNFRDYTPLKNGQVDDTPYGGGSGMVLRCEPIFNAIEAIKTQEAKVILLTPDGTTYDQNMAVSLKDEKHLILICGHYEGFDERIRTLVDYEISIGDFILTGGEIPAMVLVDSITRLIDGVITKGSLESESFNDNLLDYPTYTKPRVYNGLEVPEVLTSGDHAKIEKWRLDEQMKKTEAKRPDLLKK